VVGDRVARFVAGTRMLSALRAAIATYAGYEVVRIDFEDGRPVRFEPFVTGFPIEDGRATFGRPTGIAVGRHGALLVGDDTTGVIYRITYMP
jgi:glucose/arabinose dehydrogenase